MKVIGIIAILFGIIFIILPAVTNAWQPMGSWLIAVILIAGGFFLYRGTLGRSSQKP
ncbi:MAG TPA: hypothetical protein VJU81_11390 [Methylomirabilota bacterium]|nr:hypothetical protein [Methylomirabilota bacterium]